MLHSLLKTLISSLLRAGHTPQKIQLRTGHKSVEILTSYDTTSGEERRKQQKNILLKLSSASTSAARNKKRVNGFVLLEKAKDRQSKTRRTSNMQPSKTINSGQRTGENEVSETSNHLLFRKIVIYGNMSINYFSSPRK